MLQNCVRSAGAPLKKDLNLYFDEENIIRCQGRLKNPPLNSLAKFSILLPSGNCLIDLVISFYHIMVLHKGMKEKLNQIRTRF